MSRIKKKQLEKIRNIILYTFIILFSAQSANFLENKIFITLFFIFVAVLYFIKFKSIDYFILIFIILWFVVNIIAYLKFGNTPGIKMISFLSITARIIYPYFVIKLVSEKFFVDIEKVIFNLTLISIPIFLFQVTFPLLFYSISPYLDFFAIEEQKINGGWYLGFYMFNGWASERNSGFMWEPGAFAFMIIIAMLIRLSKNNMKFDFPILVYIIAIITTFSTMGYLVLSIIVFSKLLQRPTLFRYFLMIPVFIFSFYIQFTQLDFLAPKIEEYYLTMDNIYRSSELSGSVLRVNRFAIFELAFNESLDWPLGFGVFSETPFREKFGENIDGPNTYAQIILRLGWIGIVLFLTSLWKSTKLLFNNQRHIVKFLVFCAFITSVFSYSLMFNSILLALLYFPYLKKTASQEVIQLNTQSL